MLRGHATGGTQKCLDRIQRSLNTDRDFITIIGFVPSHPTVALFSPKHTADGITTAEHLNTEHVIWGKFFFLPRRLLGSTRACRAWEVKTEDHRLRRLPLLQTCLDDRCPIVTGVCRERQRTGSWCSEHKASSALTVTTATTFTLQLC